MCVVCKFDNVLTFSELGEYEFIVVVVHGDDEGFRLDFGRVVVVVGTIVQDV